MKKALAAAGIGAAIAVTSLLGAGTASADQFGAPGMGCQTERWGFLASRYRTICDTPRFADGHWNRARVEWRPAYYQPASSYCGSYSCSYSAGGYVSEQLFAQEAYPVNDGNVLPDEPGWIPTGTATLRG